MEAFMAFVVILSRSFPIALKTKWKDCSSSSIASRPLSFLSPEDFICFVYFGMINSVKCLRCIPLKERLKVK